MAAGPHVSLSAETIATFGELHITNSMFTSLIVSAILIILSLIINSQLTHKGRPKGLQNIFEMVIEGLTKLTHDVTQNKKHTNFIAPLATSFFLWIIFNNWLGLIPGVGTIGVTQSDEVHVQTQMINKVNAIEEVEPIMAENEIDLDGATEDHSNEGAYTDGGHEKEEKHGYFIPILRAGTADLNTTIALALIAVFSVQFIGIKELGLGYFKKFINFSSPIDFFIGVLETISEFSKIISFAFRLFGNIFAGEVLLAVIAFLIPLVAPMPFLVLEIFVGFVQALVFAMLTIVFMTMATISHDHEEH